MTAKPATLIPFPKQALQGRIPSGLLMTREIKKEDISLDLLADRLTEAGYEVEIERDDNVISVLRTGANTRIALYPDVCGLRIQSYIFLNQHLTDPDVNELLARLNENYFMPKFIAHRWDDGDLGLFCRYALHYNFGLNMPQFIHSMRRFIDNVIDAFREEIKDTAYAWVPDDPPEVVDTESASSTEDNT